MIILTSLFYFLILIISIIAHEVAHGLIAEREGDPTARVLGRITMNPLKHVDMLGSVILPGMLILTSLITGGAPFIVGWAKPVPYNARNFKNGRISEAKVAMAGIVVNLSIAVLFGILIRVLVVTGHPILPVIDIASIIVRLNIVLALFNSVPLAPLDGFRFLSAILPQRALPVLRIIEQYSLPILILFIVFGWKLLAPFAHDAFSLVTGISPMY